jgi:hypothetical protein
VKQQHGFTNVEFCVKTGYKHTSEVLKYIFRRRHYSEMFLKIKLLKLFCFEVPTDQLYRMIQSLMSKLQEVVEITWSRKCKQTSDSLLFQGYGISNFQSSFFSFCMFMWWSLHNIIRQRSYCMHACIAHFISNGKVMITAKQHGMIH